MPAAGLSGRCFSAAPGAGATGAEGRRWGSARLAGLGAAAAAAQKRENRKAEAKNELSLAARFRQVPRVSWRGLLLSGYWSAAAGRARHAWCEAQPGAWQDSGNAHQPKIGALSRLTVFGTRRNAPEPSSQLEWRWETVIKHAASTRERAWRGRVRAQAQESFIVVRDGRLVYIGEYRRGCMTYRTDPVRVWSCQKRPNFRVINPPHPKLRARFPREEKRTRSLGPCRCVLTARAALRARQRAAPTAPPQLAVSRQTRPTSDVRPPGALS